MGTLPVPLQHLPAPDETAVAASVALNVQIADEIDCGAFMPFSRFMELALYAPGLGYYAGGMAKFGAGGDYVTAPGLSSLFGASLAAQLAQLIEQGCDSILELGAGNGRMAADILHALARRDRLPKSYRVIELSSELRARQEATLAAAVPEFIDRIGWIDRLPERIDGVVIGNEVLDALPVTLVKSQGGRLLELGVGRRPAGEGFAWIARPAGAELVRAADKLGLPDDYTTELHLPACGLMRTLGERLERGAVLFADYGFPRREYYHPQRSGGTLMCHYRHHAHADPLCLVGLQDITSHVEFSGLAEAACESGLDLIGYTSQARFLINCGILELLSALDPSDVERYAPACAAVQKLLSPAEMGELFKVIAFGRGIAEPLLGFTRGDRRAML